MAGLTRTVHPASNVRWAPLKEICPDVTVRPAGAAETNGNGGDGEAMALAFADPDGEMHVYPFTAEGKQNLLSQLTGGIVLPDSRNTPPI